VFFSLALAVIVLTLLFNTIGCDNEYSVGSRVGVVNKFSRKGFMFKSYEGEMLLGGMKNKKDSDGKTNVVANTWEFSVIDQSLIEEIEKAMNENRPLKLHYLQVWASGVRTNTNYRITKVESLEE
jgi:hypothetical protein